MIRTELFLILGMALVTFAVRYPVLALASKVSLPASVLVALKFIPPAVLTAIIVPAVLLRRENGTIDLSYTNEFLVAALVAGLLAWRTNNLLLTIVMGLGVLWGWMWLLA